MRINIIEGKRNQKRKLRVAAYCRVSTDADEQENSLENQIRHYEDLIKSNPDYEYVNVYYDFGISGFKDRRPGFQKMMQDAREGKIDLILTKSISRFARNTDIVLRSTRELKELNVGVFFELQKMNTLTVEGELMMTIVAAFAQAESESGSAGAKMVYQRKYEAGIPVQYLERSFGYQKNSDGEFIPKESEAKWVRKIYEMAADGYTPAAIKRFLNDKGIKTVAESKWLDSTVFRLIENEIYKGDYIMHKHYVNEERKLVKNRGEVDSWYIEDDHIPIVSKSLWERANEAIEKKREYLATPSVVLEMNEENYPYKGKIYCAKCGKRLMPRIYSNGNRLNWGCSGTKQYGKKFCEGVNVPDSVIRGWDFDGNIYVFLKSADKGTKQFAFHRESYWKRHNSEKKYKGNLPELSEGNYPYMHRIFCRYCGGKLVRYMRQGDSTAFWICNTYKRKGASACQGVRIPDDEVRKLMPIENDIYFGLRRYKNGEKHYTHTGTKPKRSTEENTEC